jgi:hypothetical protein
VTYNAFPYILGFTYGDGNLSATSNLVRMYDENYEFVNTILRQRFTESFGMEPHLSFDKSNNSWVLHKTSAEVWAKLHTVGVPAGRKARTIVVPQEINEANSTDKSEFVSGVGDAEGSSTSFTEINRHPTGYDYFELKMYSPKFIDGLAGLLLDVSDKFNPKVYHYSYGSILRLNGGEQLELVRSRLHLMHPRFNPPAH